MLWTAGKECLQVYTSNVNTECHYYEDTGKYAIINNSNDMQETDFYDINGNKKTIKLQPMEINWEISD